MNALAERPTPRVIQVTSGRFHQFDLARQLERRGLLEAIFTAYPRWKLTREGLPRPKVRTFPWWHTPWMGGGSRLLGWMGCNDAFHAWSLGQLDAHVARSLPHDANVLVAMSGHAVKSGARVQQAGGSWICVRGSTHIRHQDEVVRSEQRAWKLPETQRGAALIAREEHEYTHADRVAVPSRAALATFVEYGFPRERLALVPYGVDLSRFFPEEKPAEGEFNVAFVGALSVRKGLGHLLQAFARLKHPRKRLLLAGARTPETATLLSHAPAGVEILGHQPQRAIRALLSRAHVFVLCSIEEGLANVLGQALACGCPVIATKASGAEDLFTDGREGFIVDGTVVATVAEKLEQLAQDDALRIRMSEAALRRVRDLGGWDQYGDAMEALIREVMSPKP